MVDPVTNKAYLTNYLWYGTMTMIDGASDLTSTVPVGAYPSALAANWSSNRIYVTNSNDNTVSVIAGATSGALLFVPMTPCRVVDTRWANGPFGGPPIQIGTYRTFVIPNSPCLRGMPASGRSLLVQCHHCSARSAGVPDGLAHRRGQVSHLAVEFSRRTNQG